MKTKNIITLAISLIALGIMLLSFTACSGEGLTNLFLSHYEAQTIDISDDFADIFIETDTADVQFLISEDDECHVVAYTQKNINYDAKVEDGVLNISIHDDREWYEYIQVGVESSSLTVFLPKNEYSDFTLKGSTCNVLLSDNFKFEDIDIMVSTGDIEASASATGNVSLTSSTGDIDLSDMSAASISLTVSSGYIEVENVVSAGDFTINVSTGDAEIENMTCVNFSSEGSTGNLEMENVIASGNITIARSTGTVSLYACDAAELDIKMGTGDVKGVLLTSKVFITRTSTGKIDVPESTEGGKCKIVTSTGDIKFEIADGN